MTEDVLLIISGRKADVSQRWTAKAYGLVDKAVDRAHAHSVVALTETLRDTPDGRKTLRKASQSRSYAAAVADLDAMQDALTGPSVASLEGLLRDARADLYTVALAGWLEFFPAEFSVSPDTEPTQARLNEMRGLVLHGMELRREIGGRVDQAKRDLLATLEMAARRGQINPHSARFLAGWKSRTTSTLNLCVALAISDATVAIDAIAGVDAVRPEFRPKNRYTPS